MMMIMVVAIVVIIINNSNSKIIIVIITTIIILLQTKQSCHQLLKSGLFTLSNPDHMLQVLVLKKFVVQKVRYDI